MNKTKLLSSITIVAGTLTSTLFGTSLTWDGANFGNWNDATNWNPDQAPTAADDLDFTGEAVAVFGTSVTANSLSAGDGSRFRVRVTGQSFTGAFTLTGSDGATSDLLFTESGDVARDFTFNGPATFGGTDMRFNVLGADELTLNFDSLLFNSGSNISKRSTGDLIINANTFTGNANTMIISEGDLTLGGSASYNTLEIDVEASGALNLANNITLAGLTIDGNEIAAGVYNSGDAIFTTYAGNLLDNGGTLTISAIPEPSSYAVIGGCIALGLVAFSRNRRR